MRKTVTGLLTVILVGVFAAVVFAAVDSSTGTPAGTTTDDRTNTTGDNTTTTEDRAKHREDRGRAREAGEDVSGPCDEAEHANDPSCNGVTLPGNAGGQTPATGQTRTTEDVSGPCDEAEHASDPRCTGGAGTAEDHNQVEDNHVRGADDDAADDHSGPGSGGDDSSDDHSGSGHSGGSDDGGDDHSGSGHGGGSDD